MSVAAVIGVDAHPGSITGVLVNHQAQKQTSLTVTNNDTGITQLLELAQEHQAVFAIENAKAFALNLTAKPSPRTSASTTYQPTVWLDCDPDGLKPKMTNGMPPMLLSGT